MLDTAEAIVAGGCFWGIEHRLKQIPGVLKAESGYTGGHKLFPSYTDVCNGGTGHYEAVRVVYDLSTMDYHAILKHFFAFHNPYQADGQGLDRGLQYRSAVFCYDDLQKQIALEWIKKLSKDSQVATSIHPVTTFWPAEEYHQDYYNKHPDSGYKCN